MNDRKNKNEANLGHLLFGERSPLSLHVCLKPMVDGDELIAAMDPFEMVSLGVGRRYYLAKLNLGHGFAEAYILLNIYQAQKDEAAVHELSLLQKYQHDQQSPIPSVIDFSFAQESSQSSIFAPTFYCSKTKVFFHIPCQNCSRDLLFDEKTEGLYCPDCRHSKSDHTIYSYYGKDNAEVNDENIVLLENVFAQVAEGNNVASGIPCGDCRFANQCFSNKPDISHGVANEHHFIIPFSHESFSVYGFSYYPISLQDYCELVSGKSKVDYLKRVIANKEYGRYKVLSETGSLVHKIEKKKYLISRVPDIAAILSIKLRVFLRICDALRQFDSDIDIESVTQSVINMDMSQMVTAGDSFARARIVIYPNVNNSFRGDFDASTQSENGGALTSEVPGTLSNILLVIFFKNKKNNELLIQNAFSTLTKIINSNTDVSLKDLSDIIEDSCEVRSVFNLGNFRYNGTEHFKEDDCFYEILLLILRMALVLSGNLKQPIDLKENEKGIMSYTFPLLISDLKKMFQMIEDKCEGASSDISQQLIKQAMSEIVEDKHWLADFYSALAISQEKKTKHTNAGSDSEFAASASLDQVVENTLEDTVVHNKDLPDMEKTILMRKKVLEEAELNDEMIILSINRILRQM